MYGVFFANYSRHIIYITIALPIYSFSITVALLVHSIVYIYAHDSESLVVIITMYSHASYAIYVDLISYVCTIYVYDIDTKWPKPVAISMFSPIHVYRTSSIQVSIHANAYTLPKYTNCNIRNLAKYT